MKNSFESQKNKFLDFYNKVKEGHHLSQRQHNGHGLDHDVTVGQLVLAISPDNRTADKAWCAAMLHSTDRIVENGAVKDHMKECLQYLPVDFFTKEEVVEILEAALRHGELSQNDQSLTQQVLMDADRLANLMPAVIIRSGQFRPSIPAFEFEYLDGKPNPASTYREPKSILDDLRISITEYLPQFRVSMAIELAHRYARQLEAHIQSVEESNKELSLSNINL